MWKLAYPFLAIADLLSSLIALTLINWWAPLFATKDAHLPRWLAWFDTFDADLDTGNRELGWNAGYWGRVRWLNRNHSYGFSYWALGIPFDPAKWAVQEYRSEGGETLFKARSIDGHFNIYMIRFGIRLKLGWKAWNMFDTATGTWKTQPWGPEWRVPFVFSISKA
ncbi:hypothetical protein [Herbaspirillum sp. ST 5-3]|uniref:DUF7338 family protein n=1 Tax=Oxalobacteraceae TaxID=75682 RepID=UPI0010A50A63|nr:hypothetical protein [Herbaspirillum sp. ST 5-3]